MIFLGKLLGPKAMIAALFVLTQALPSTPAQAAGLDRESLQEAEKFIGAFGEKAVGELADEALSEEERNERFRTLLREGFDIPHIARFIAARYWRTAKPEEQDEFIRIFADYLTGRFAPLFEGYPVENFSVTASVADSKYPDIAWVTVRVLNADDGQHITSEWRLRHEESGGWKILDLKVEGASLSLTLRDEYGSVMRQNGGLSGLNRLLAEQVYKRQQQ